MTQETLPIAEDWAKFAGLMDGEGSFCLNLNSDGWLQPRMDFTNIDPVLHSWIRERFGGKTTPHTKHKKVLMTYWQNPAQMKVLLEGLLPHIVSKKTEVYLLLRYVNSTGGRGHRNTLSIEERLLIAAQLKVLHQQKRS
jgi:hypothetical protein